MEDEAEGGLKAVTITTEEEAQSRNLSDVAMPVVGSKIPYIFLYLSIPSVKELATIYLEIMNEDGITEEMFKHHDDV